MTNELLLLIVGLGTLGIMFIWVSFKMIIDSIPKKVSRADIWDDLTYLHMTNVSIFKTVYYLVNKYQIPKKTSLECYYLHKKYQHYSFDKLLEGKKYKGSSLT